MLECSPVDAPAPEASAPQHVGCLCHSPAFARVNALLTEKLSRRAFLGGATAGVGALAFGSRAARARVPDLPDSPVAFTNVRVFDGTSGALRNGLRVVVDGRTIKAVEPADTPLAPGVRAMDCGGRVLMPGLIDAHWHAMMAALPLNVLLTADIGYITLAAADQAEQTLMRGFTSIRDMAGPTFSLKRAIDGGIVPGPRVWPSGAMISQTGGHGDFRFPYEIPAAPNAPLSHGDATGAGAIADGVDRVLQRAREQLMLGASQLKLAAGGGVSSNYDPIDVSQYTEAEFRAAVDAAENWGTYVTVHAYMPRAIQTAIRGGVRCIEHGHLMDEATAKIMADKGNLAQLAAVPGRRGRLPLSRGFGEPGEAVAGVARHRHGIRPGQAVSAQDRLGHGHAVRSQAHRPPGRAAGEDGPLVYARRSSQDGDQH